MNKRILHGLLWREWLLHKTELTWIFAIWLLAVWVVPIHPAFFMIPFGVLAACVIAPSFGGSDASEGSEEFSFALPPSRAQRYLVRLALGGGTLLLLMAGSLAAALFDLPQAIWGIVFESGYTVPFATPPAPFVYGLACALTAGVFADAFAAGACSRTPGGSGFLWLRALLLTGIIMGWGMLMEGMIWRGNLNGVLCCPMLGAWTLLRLSWGYRDYHFKEGVSGLPGLRPQGRSRTWIVLGVVLVLVVILALMYFVSSRGPL
jgi:hypothetical protein